MIEPVFLSTFTDVFWSVLVVMFIIIPILLMWLFAMTDLILRHDIRWAKVIWLLVIIFLPIFGPIVYLLVRPDPARVAPPPGTMS